MDKKVRHIALFFGSFNPIHLAHTKIASIVLHENLASEVWFVVSPHNPDKEHHTLAPALTRFNWVKKSIQGLDKMYVCDIEFTLPQPSYTVFTLRQLRQQYSDYQFSILMGQDNAEGFHRWKLNDEILQNIEHIIVYPRSNLDGRSFILPEVQAKMHWIENPLWQISSTEIRERIKQEQSIESLVPIGIQQEITNYYRSLSANKS